MNVIATRGTKCPMEGKPREYITDTLVVNVPDTTYYQRLIMDGSLIKVPETPPKAKQADKPKQGGEES